MTLLISQFSLLPFIHHETPSSLNSSVKIKYIRNISNKTQEHHRIDMPHTLNMPRGEIWK
jgi:hypothetical protein